MYSFGHMVCLSMAIFAVMVEGLPRYRRQSFEQYASQLTVDTAQLGKLSLGAQAYGSGNSLINYNITGQAQANIPIYNGGANLPSVNLDGTAGVTFGSSNGQMFGPNPNYDAGVNVNLPFSGLPL